MCQAGLNTAVDAAAESLLPTTSTETRCSFCTTLVFTPAPSLAGARFTTGVLYGAGHDRWLLALYQYISQHRVLTA